MENQNGRAAIEFGAAADATSSVEREDPWSSEHWAYEVASPIRPAHELLEADAGGAFGRTEAYQEDQLDEDERYEDEGADPKPEFLGEDRSSREYILWVQRSLNRLLGMTLSVDGIMGPRTRDATRRFQAQRGLTVDGIFGPRTERALLQAGASPPPGRDSPTVPPTGIMPPAGTETDVRVVDAGPTTPSSSLERGVRVSGLARFAPEGQPNDIVLAATAAAEGGYDTVNMYDRGIISWGIMQWTAHAGSLQAMLAFLKRRLGETGQAHLWASLFPNLDIIVIDREPQFRIDGAATVGIPALRRAFRGSEERGHFDRRTIETWARVFARAGRHPTAQRLQRDYARGRVDAVMARSIPSRVGTGYSRVGAYVEGAVKAKALFFGAWTNNPLQSYRELTRAVDAVAAGWGGKDPARWPAGWQSRFADQFERTLRASRFGMWGDDKARAAGRTSRTQRTLDALRALAPDSATPQREAYPVPPRETSAETWSEVERRWEELAAIAELTAGGSVPSHEEEVWAEASDGAGAWSAEGEYLQEMTGEDGWLEQPSGETWSEVGSGAVWGAPAGEDEGSRPSDEPSIDPSGEDSVLEQEDEGDRESWQEDGIGSPLGEDETRRSAPAYVRWVQSALNQVAGTALTVDGISGSRTRSAVMSFQSSRGLVVDGIVGPRTEQALLAAGAPPTPASGSTAVAAPPLGSPSVATTTSCRGARPTASTTIVVAGREVPSAGLAVTNWADGSVRPFTHPSRARCRRPGTVTSFVLHETQGSIPWRPFRRDFLNDKRNLSVHMYADVDGRIFQHNDLVEVLWHGSAYNAASIGIEIVAPVLPAIRATVLRQASNLTFPMSRELGLAPYQAITTGWMQRRTDNPSREYVVPPIDQLEGVTKLIALVTDPGAGHGLAIPRRWVGDRGDGTFVVRGGASFARLQAGIIGHVQYVETKDDGAFPALYSWLRLAARGGRGLDPASAYDATIRLLNGAGRSVDVSSYR